MGIIKKLDEHTTNLIAAGEVIERAASVVKELVENSIDAKATKILIQLVESGLTEIRVIDDGVGMDPIDAKLCVMPHATSKIQNESDLFNIHTLGFRGEALASIVAVSNFRLITSVDGSSGMRYSLKGGVPMSEGVIAHGKGTEIIVKNLFLVSSSKLSVIFKVSTKPFIDVIGVFNSWLTFATNSFLIFSNFTYSVTFSIFIINPITASVSSK